MSEARKKQIVSMILGGMPPQTGGAGGAQEFAGDIPYGSPSRVAATALSGDDPAAMPRSLSGGAVLRTFHPTLRDQLADWILGDGRPSVYKRRLVTDLIGSAGLGNEGLSAIDFTPLGVGFAAEETGRSVADGNYGEAVIEALGMLPAPALRAAVKGGRSAIARADTVIAPLPAPPVDKALGMTAEKTQDAGFLASRSARIYDPPVKQPRPFEADYRPGDPRHEAAGGIADESGRLRLDMDGRPLTARYVAGRTVVGGGDTGLSAEAYDELGKAGTGGRPEAVAKSAIAGDAGRYVVDRDRRSGDVLSQDIFYDESLPADKAGRVVAHELAHAIDAIAGKMPTDGIDKELRTIYNDLNNPQSYGKRFGPEQNKYWGEHVRNELVAEAIRAYMAAPNYIKTVAPKAAARIRQYVNTHPKLKNTIQFNSIGGFGVTGIAAGTNGLAGYGANGQRTREGEL
ncbi:hypothetical protein GOC73_17455 [Sinorhizobium medicae]|nr:hypothetical protein [Sinorhizobium medicae]